MVSSQLKYSHSPKSFLTDQGTLLIGESDFTPDPAIVKQDGDVTLIFLSGNGLLFVPQADDDWYRATVPNGYVIASNSTKEMLGVYRPEEAASPLGCVEQYQWCRDPTRGQCGNLDGRFGAVFSAAPLFNVTSEDLDHRRPVSSNKMGSLLLWSYYNIFQSGFSLYGVVSTLGPTSLASHLMVATGSVGSLAKNQWQLDVTKCVLAL